MYPKIFRHRANQGSVPGSVLVSELQVLHSRKYGKCRPSRTLAPPTGPGVKTFSGSLPGVEFYVLGDICFK